VLTTVYNDSQMGSPAAPTGLTITLTVAFASCAAPAHYPGIAHIQVIRSSAAEPITLEGGAKIGGCSYSIDATRDRIAIRTRLCGILDGHVKDDGFTTLFPREPPRTIFNRLVAVLEQNRVLEFTEPSPEPSLYPNSTYTIEVDGDGISKKLTFVVDPDVPRTLNPNETKIALLFNSLVGAAERGGVRMGVVQ
jgi:hypothetical protein